MIVTPFSNEILYENDLEGFAMPYRFYGQVDEQNMKARYMALRKSSYGYIVRLGIAQA